MEDSSITVKMVSILDSQLEDASQDFDAIKQVKLSKFCWDLGWDVYFHSQSQHERRTATMEKMDSRLTWIKSWELLAREPIRLIYIIHIHIYIYCISCSRAELNLTQRLLVQSLMFDV